MAKTAGISEHALIGLGVMLAAGGCQTTTRGMGADDGLDVRQAASGEVADLDAAAAEDVVDTLRTVETREPASNAETRYGDAKFVSPPRSNVPEETVLSGGQSFQFRDAPIDLVLSQVLGDGFGESFVIAPDVSATVTLRLENVASAEMAVDALNAAIEQRGLNIRSSNGGYVLSRTSSALSSADGRFDVIYGDDGEPTGDAAILALRNANPEDVVELARPLLPPDVVKAVDASRGLIALRGAPRDVAAAVDALRAFDVDWFDATSAALVELETAVPADIKRELDLILERSGGVEIVSLPRLRSVMVFARTPALLDRAQSLIVQLDRSRIQGGDSETLVYEARNVSAEKLADAAEQLFANPGYGAVPSPPLVSSQTLQPSPIVENQTVRFAVDGELNLLLATGDPSELSRVREFLQRIDRPQAQVLIEATIVEVTLRDEFRFGVNWSGLDGNLDFTFTDNEQGVAASRFPGLSIAYANTDIDAVVNALDSETDVRVVSSPRVLALNNTTARIQVGDQVPIVVQSAISVADPGAPIVNATEYRDTGVILDVTPRVRGTMIEVEVSQEISDVAETVTSGIDSPTISQRLLKSVLAVPDGATIAMGGLISSNISQSEVGVPILRELPFLKRLFSSTTDIERRSEIVVLVRPQIVFGDEPEIALSDQLMTALSRVRPEYLTDAW